MRRRDPFDGPAFELTDDWTFVEAEVEVLARASLARIQFSFGDDAETYAHLLTGCVACRQFVSTLSARPACKRIARTHAGFDPLQGISSPIHARP